MKDIAGKHNFTAKVDIPEDIQLEFLSQGGKSDWTFLQELADETGCVFWVKNDELHFEPDKENEPVYKFTWGKDGDGYLQSLSITANAEKGKGTSRGIEMAGINPLTKEKIKETSAVQAAGSSARAIALGDKPVSENVKGGGSLAENKVSGETALKAKNDEAGVIKTAVSGNKAAARRAGAR